VLERRHHAVAETRVVGRVELLGDARELREGAAVDAGDHVQARQDAVVVGGFVHPHATIELFELHGASPDASIFGD